MQITEITISYEATQSLSGYCNVRPGIRLTAHVEEKENPQEIRTRLFNDARAIVQDEIDAALIRDNQPPRYYAGPRFRVEYNRETCQIVIMPDTQIAYRALLTRGNWQSHFSIKPTRQMSADQARNVAARLADNLRPGTEKAYLIVDCSDGNLTRLPLAAAQPGDPDTDPTRLEGEYDEPFERDETDDDEEDR